LLGKRTDLMPGFY